MFMQEQDYRERRKCDPAKHQSDEATDKCQRCLPQNALAAENVAPVRLSEYDSCSGLVQENRKLGEDQSINRAYVDRVVLKSWMFEVGGEGSVELVETRGASSGPGFRGCPKGRLVWPRPQLRWRLVLFVRGGVKVLPGPKSISKLFYDGDGVPDPIPVLGAFCSCPSAVSNRPPSDNLLAFLSAGRIQWKLVF